MKTDYLFNNPLSQIGVGDTAPAGFNIEHPDYIKYKDIWETCRDAEAGQHAVKKKKTRYLPKLSGQSEQEYLNYLNRALYYNATGRTVQSYEGMIFRKDPIISVNNNEGSASIEIDKSTYYSRVTNEGKSLASVVQDVVHEAIITNKLGILVDYPAAEEVGSVSSMTKADKEALDYKPLLNIYKAESIINWHTAYINNKPVPVMYVLKEEVYMYDGGLYPSKQDAYRILMLEPYRESEEGPVLYRYKEISMFPTMIPINGQSTLKHQVTDVIYPRKGGQYLNFIPFYVITDKGIDFQNQETPIIYDLAELNISHYRNSADWENELHIVAAKTVYFPGWDTDMYGQPRFGGALAGPKDCTPSIIEASNKSGLADEMKAKEERMSVLGSEAISKQGRYVASAATAKISSKAEASILTTLSTSLSKAFSEILTFALDWDDRSGLSVSVVLNTDFYDEEIAPDQFREYVRAYQSGAISRSAFFNILQKKEFYSPEWTESEEFKQIQEDMGALFDLPEDRYNEVMSRVNDLTIMLKSSESAATANLIASGIPEGTPEDREKLKKSMNSVEEPIEEEDE